MQLIYFFNIPTWLTLLRLVGSPVVLPLLLVYLLPYNIGLINGLLAALFLCFGLTDFLDGYLARKYHQVTALGKVLDPMADKFLLYATLVALVAANKLYFYWAILLIGREFFVMGLRLLALEQQSALPVSYLGKLKTVLQITMLALIIANPYHGQSTVHALYWNNAETLLLSIASLTSLISAWLYYQSYSVQVKGDNPPETQMQLEE